MKKLYLLLLVFLLLFIPATNAVTPYQLDHPITELNNHTLREVFEINSTSILDDPFTLYKLTKNENILTKTAIEYGAIFKDNLIINDVFYQIIKFKVLTNDIQYVAMGTTITHNRINIPILNEVYTITNSYIPQSIRNHIYIGGQINSQIQVIEDYTINQTALGLFHLTVEQMDMYYEYYLKAVQFEIDYYEAGLDPGEYQHIFKSILNGVKNLISEMGYVWQWLNAPIITSDMQDYSFNIDWSWDLIGVIRQIMNSAGILTLQIAFWVPSLAFAFMGIPIQISVLSLLFSNLIFLLLGWILVKSLLI